MELKKQFRAISVYDIDIKIINEVINQMTTSQLKDPKIGRMSTEELWSQFWERIQLNKSREYKQIAIFLDVEAAFNAASHPPILEQLRKQGIDKRLFKVHQNYLKDRKIEWKDSKEVRYEKDLTRGTFQGASLASFHFA